MSVAMAAVCSCRALACADLLRLLHDKWLLQWTVYSKMHLLQSALLAIADQGCLLCVESLLFLTLSLASQDV